MTERYSTFILRIRALADLDPLYFDGDAAVWDVNGRQEINAAGRGSFKLYASDAALLSAIESNIGQVVTVYVTDQVAAGANMDLATFIIKNIDTETDEGVSIVTVSGPEITDQLRNTDAGDNAIDNGAGGPSLTDISAIMGYASAGWSLTGATATAAGTYHASRGDTVLKLLNAAAQQSGEIFRLATYTEATSKGIFWTAAPDASGVFLFMPTSHNQYDGSTTVGKLYSLRREYDFEPVITSIRPYGAGVGGGRLDITNIDSSDTGADPAWLDTTFASNLMVNSDLLTALGYPIKQDIDFSWIQANDPTNATQLVSAAVAVWKTGKNYLEQNDAAREFYTAVCNVAANLRPGQSVTLVYPEFQGGITGGSQTIDIDKTLTILSVENRFEEGERITTLTLGDKPLPQPTAASWVADVAEKTQDTTRKSDPSTSPGAVSTSRTLNAVLPLRIDGGASGDLSANRTFTLDGLTSYGAANQVAGVNAAATGWEYKTLTEGTGITIGHSAGAITITNSSPGGTDISNLAYVTIGNTGSLSAERALTEGDGIDIADGGANSTVTLSVDVTDFIGNGLVEVATNNVALGTPGSLTASSTNAVTASSHTHAADSTIARSQISISAGAGLTGGGNLTANRTIDVGEGDGIDVAADSIAVDVTDIIGNGLVEVATNNIALGTPGSTTSTSTNAVTASSHTHEADSTLARSQISITAGDGLTGGGNLTANRTITMGTPSTLTVSTTNGVTASSHTHAITSSSAVSTATAVLLATDSSGRVQTTGYSAGAAINGDGNALATPKIYAHDGTIAVSQDGDGAFLDLYSYGTDASDFSAIRARRGRGTRGTPAAVQSGDILGRFGGGGHDGGSFENESAGWVQVVAAENWSGANQGAEVQVYTSPSGSTTAVKVATFHQNGWQTWVASPRMVLGISVGGNSDTNFDIDYPSVTTSGAWLRLFRSTNTSGTRQLVIYRGNGSSTADHTFSANGGYVVGSPTGGDKGVGTINAQAIYDDNVLVSDHLWDLYYDGKMMPADDRRYKDARLWGIEETAVFTKENRHLPTLPSRDDWEKGGSHPIGTLITGLWQAVELLQMQVYELKELKHGG